MTVLVTGGAGFIGYARRARRCSRGATEVVGIDNLNDYYDPALKQARLAAAARACRASLRAGSTSPTAAPTAGAVRAASRSTRVVHLAAQAGVRYSLENPARLRRQPTSSAS